jgi:hypothetical protein
MEADDNIPRQRNGHKTTKAGREYHRTRLDDHIAQMLTLIIGIAPYYLDTLHFRTRRYITDDERDAVKALAGDAVFPEGKDKRWDRYGLIVHQPSADALRYIEQHWRDHLIVRFDVAIDFFTRSIEDAIALRNLLWRIVVMQWHGKRKTHLYDGKTLYHSQPWQGRNFAIYDDEFSKIDPTTPQPNVHFELKYTKAAGCRAHGVRKARDLFGWVLYPYLEREVRLAVIDWDKAEPVVAKLARDEEPDNAKSADFGSRVRRYKRLKSAVISGGGPIPAWGEGLEDFGVQRCLDIVPALKPVALKTDMFPIINVRRPQPPTHPWFLPAPFKVKPPPIPPSEAAIDAKLTERRQQLAEAHNRAKEAQEAVSEARQISQRADRGVVRPTGNGRYAEEDRLVFRFPNTAIAPSVGAPVWPLGLPAYGASPINLLVSRHDRPAGADACR